THEFFDLLGDLRSYGAAGGGQRERDPDAAVLDLHSVDQAQLDEVETQLGIDHVREGLHDVILGGRGGGVGHAASLAWVPARSTSRQPAALNPERSPPRNTSGSRPAGYCARNVAAERRDGP